MLKGELRKIDARKREREKKTADLQKLIAQADTPTPHLVRIQKFNKDVSCLV